MVLRPNRNQWPNQRSIDPRAGLERGLDREPEPDLALESAAPRTLEPIEPIEPMEPIEAMESMEPVELNEPREPMRLLPLAVMLVAGMLVGFVAGYAVGTRG